MSWKKTQIKSVICLQPGENVVYSKYAGIEVEMNGDKHLLLKEDDIIGTLDSDDVKDLKPLNDRVLLKVFIDILTPQVMFKFMKRIDNFVFEIFNLSSYV